MHPRRDPVRESIGPDGRGRGEIRWAGRCWWNYLLSHDVGCQTRLIPQEEVAPHEVTRASPGANWGDWNGWSPQWPRQRHGQAAVVFGAVDADRAERRQVRREPLHVQQRGAALA